MTGEIITHNEITAKRIERGRGVVCRARDTKLGPDVPLKVQAAPTQQGGCSLHV